MKFAYVFWYMLLFPLAKLIVPCIVKGRENIPDGPVIVCANHTNILDPVLIAYAFGHKRQLFFMAKAELFKIPIVGSIFKTVGVFPIVRGETDINSIRTAMRHLKNGEQIIGLFESIRQEFGTTVVIITHDPSIARRADRIIQLVDGRVV